VKNNKLNITIGDAVKLYEEHKTCNKCKIAKDKDCFVKNRGECKECIKEYNKQYRAEHKEEIKEYSKQYYSENKDKIKEYNKQYNIENKEEIKENKKEYYIKNKEERKEYRKQYYIEHKEEIKEYLSEHKEERKEYRNEYQKNRMKTDPVFKLRKSVSISIRIALRSDGSSKNGSSILKYLPYTIEELKNYLELLFEPWMSWENHGQYDAKAWNINDQSTWAWNLDHITPQTHLPYTSMEDINFKKCWALENLRPYNAKKNMEESNNRSQEEIAKIKNDIEEKLKYQT